MHITVDRDYLITTTQKLIRFPSVNPPGDVREVGSFVASEFAAMGLEVEEIAGKPDKPNLLVRWPGDRPGKTLILYAHTDVVPVAEEERRRWVCDPFEGVLREGVLYGRGAVDAKSKIAALMAAVRALRRAGQRLSGEVRILIVADGEIGDQGGLKFLSERRPEVLQGDMAVGCEPSGLKVLRAYKGRLWLRVIVEGKQAHSIVPEAGINAIEQMTMVLPELLATDFSEPPVLEEGVEEELLGGVTKACTTISGGTGLNVAPARCEATLDLRLMPGQSVAGVLADVLRRRDELQRQRDGVAIDIQVIPGSGREPVVIPRDAPVVQALSSAFRAVTGRDATYGKGYSSGGLYHFHKRGIPAVYFGSGEIWEAHRENESVTMT